MSNIAINAPAVDGSQWEVHRKGDSCKTAVQLVMADDHGAPLLRLVIEVTTGSGKVVEVSIPYSHDGQASVRIDGQTV